MSDFAPIVCRLRRIAVDALGRMYRPEEHMFAFRLRREDNGRVVAEGFSSRYSAITLIGLASQPGEVVGEVLRSDPVDAVCDRLAGLLHDTDNLGDAALIWWALGLWGHGGAGAAFEHLAKIFANARVYQTVEVSWALAASCAAGGRDEARRFRQRIFEVLLGAFVGETGMFRHSAGGGSQLRKHVCCFADLAYPIFSLSMYSALTGDRVALDVAQRCAARVCSLQGQSGQWWWHYDVRSGAVLERYPVYAVHQDAMTPMALLLLQQVGRGDYSEPVYSGLSWLLASPELDGGSLVDDRSGLIWRKVCRREPMKISRTVRALASFIHPSARVPGLDAMFPPKGVDYECRPYHFGWLLYAWTSVQAGLCGKL